MKQVLAPRLAVDCSGAYLSVALDTGAYIMLRHENGTNLHSKLLLFFIQELLKEAVIQPKDLKQLIYTCGPGSFTGLKIALSLLKGIALPHQIPLLPIPTLDHLAFSFTQKNTSSAVITCIDARMAEVFTAAYLTDPFKKIHQDSLLKTGSSIWQYYLSQYPRASYVATTAAIEGLSLQHLHCHIPQADSLFQLAGQSVYVPTTANEARLFYLRDKVALTLQEQMTRYGPH
jgi:universal bacterial protein yeaZ